MKKKLQTIPQVQNLVAARYRNGKIIRGATHDFGPRKKVFHVNTFGEGGREVGGNVFEVSFSELKAIFFVKSLEGRQGPPPHQGIDGRKIGSSRGVENAGHIF